MYMISFNYIYSLTFTFDYASGVDLRKSNHVKGKNVKQSQQVLFDVTVNTEYDVSNNKLGAFEKIGT